jgi:hypothetical protein
MTREQYVVLNGKYIAVEYPMTDVLSGRIDFSPLLASLHYTSEPGDVLHRLFFCTRWCRA